MDTLLSLNRELQELELKQKQIIKDFEMNFDSSMAKVKKVKGRIQLLNNNVDLQKVDRGLEILKIEFPKRYNAPVGGNSYSMVYADLINAAQADILNGCPYLKTYYIGQKRYEGFDQRCDCKYGYGPTHGAIYQSIGLFNPNKELTEYDLECCLYLLANLKHVLEVKNNV